MTNDKSLPVVTVLIASYNHAHYVRESILSVLKQTYKNIQLIVIDDGSTDNSVTIIDVLAKQYDFQFISQENAGLPAVLNRGIALAKGKYFVSFGSDDIMVLDRIEKQVAWMEAHPSFAVCAGNIIEVDADGQPLYKQHFPPACNLGFEDIFTHSVRNIRAPTAMIRRDVFDAVGHYDPSIRLEDIYMWLKIANRGYGIHVMSDILAYCRKHPTNNSKNMLFMADSFISIYSPYKTHPLYNKTINRLLINLFLKSARRGYQNSLAVLRKVSPRYYNFKVLVGLVNLVFRK